MYIYIYVHVCMCVFCDASFCSIISDYVYCIILYCTLRYYCLGGCMLYALCYLIYASWFPLRRRSPRTCLCEILTRKPSMRSNPRCSHAASRSSTRRRKQTAEIAQEEIETSAERRLQASFRIHQLLHRQWFPAPKVGLAWVKVPHFSWVQALSAL